MVPMAEIGNHLEHSTQAVAVAVAILDTQQVLAVMAAAEMAEVMLLPQVLLELQTVAVAEVAVAILALTAVQVALEL
jgi:hypothetical protein